MLGLYISPSLTPYNHERNWSCIADEETAAWGVQWLAQDHTAGISSVSTWPQGLICIEHSLVRPRTSLARITIIALSFLHRSFLSTSIQSYSLWLPRGILLKLCFLSYHSVHCKPPVTLWYPNCQGLPSSGHIWLFSIISHYKYLLTTYLRLGSGVIDI